MAALDLRVLVIDDSRSILSQVKGILASVGFIVTTAPGPQEGLAALIDTHPEIILLDIEMPTMDGFQLCSYIRRKQEWNSIPVIFLSGHRDEESILKGFALGGNDYIQKPFSDREMIARVEAHGIKARIEQELAQKTRALENLSKHQDHIIQERTRALQKNQELLVETLAMLAKERDAQASLVNAVKLSSLGDLVADVAHEINTPLGNSITLASYLGQATRKLEEDYRQQHLSGSAFADYLAKGLESIPLLIENLDRMAVLIDRFKTVSLTNYNDAATEFNSHELVEALKLVYEPQLRELGVTFMRDGSENISLHTYGGALREVLHSLIGNALAHGFSGKSRSGLDQVRKIVLVCSVVDGTVNVEIRNNGRPIEPDILAKIWEPFFSTRKADGFLGLGLFLAHNLVTGKLGGSIDCRSSPELGTIFTLAFPQKANI